VKLLPSREISTAEIGVLNRVDSHQLACPFFLFVLKKSEDITVKRNLRCSNRCFELCRFASVGFSFLFVLKKSEDTTVKRNEEVTCLLCYLLANAVEVRTNRSLRPD
jgi:hypothetical protein